MTTLLIAAIAIASMIQYYFWFMHFSITSQPKMIGQTDATPLVSVVICAHNDGSHLAKNLPFVLDQTYKHFEVVVVDHGSTDDTENVLKKFAGQYANVQKKFVPFDRPGKRDALQVGIETARGSILLLTDADCSPSSSEWINKMVEPIRNGHDLVLGAAPFAPSRNIINVWSRWENMVTLQLFTSEGIRQRPFMALGRNMAVRKSLAAPPKIEYGGLIGGDDDLFVNHLARAWSTYVVLDPSAHMVSPAKTTIKSLFRQKRRHVSTSWKYRWRDQLFLSLFAVSTWTQLLGVLVLVMIGFWPFALGIYLIRFTGLNGRIRAVSSHQPAFQFGWLLPLVDFAYLAYYPLVVLFLIKKPPSKWK